MMAFTPRYFKDVYAPARDQEVEAAECVDAVVAWADEHYACDDTRTRFEVAYSYIAAAKFLAARSPEHHGRASRLFHFAGHHLRKLEEWKDAGAAYEASGVKGISASAKASAGSNITLAAEEAEWAVRSFARAKNCYSDVGDTPEAARAYTMEQDARRRVARYRSHHWEWAILCLWKLTSSYGQSLGRWFACLVTLVVLSSVCYEFEHRADMLQVSPKLSWLPVVSAVYYALVTLSTLGYGDISPKHWAAQVSVVGELAFGYLLLGLGAGIIARRVRQR